MLRFNIKKWVILAALTTSLCGAIPLLAQTGGLEGEVKDDKGGALVGYPILIERQDIKGTYKTKTDKHGHYVYVGLPIGNYKITLQDPNGKTMFFFNSKHVGLGDPTQQDFDMGKEKAEAVKTQQANPEQQKKMEEENKEQKQYVGLKATFDQAGALYTEKKYSEAAAMYEQAVPLAKDKNLLAVLSRLGDSYDKARQYDKALLAYQKLLSIDATNAEVHNSLGNVYAETNKIPDAMAEFQKSAELNPAGAAHAYFNLGATLYNAGKMDEAAGAFKKATVADPKYADAYALWGRALMGKLTMTPDGKTMIAPPGTVEALETYLKLDPTGKFAQEAQGDLQVIRGSVQTEYKVEKRKKKS